MNAAMQVKLLRVLQERRFRRLGGTDEVRADVRVIAATNQELPRLVAEGRFREDLFYRINVIGVQLPTLRDRLEDIPLLADHFLAKFSTHMEKPVRAISREAHERLAAYRWPGNVREPRTQLTRRGGGADPTLLREPAATRAPDCAGPRSTARGSAGNATEVSRVAGRIRLEARGEDFYRPTLPSPWNGRGASRPRRPSFWV